MEDNKTTTDAGTSDAGADSFDAEPEQNTQQTAAIQPAEPTQTQGNGPSDSTDDNHNDWLVKKGIDPESPEALSKLAEIARNSEKKMHESTQKASELEKTLQAGIEEAASSGDLDAVERLTAEVQGLKTVQNVNSFFQSNPEAKEYEAKMTEIVTERPEINTLVNQGYLSLQDLYSLAKADPEREAKLKQDGGREALKKVATKQQAKAVVGNATNSDVEPPEVDEFLQGFDSDS